MNAIANGIIGAGIVDETTRIALESALEPRMMDMLNRAAIDDVIGFKYHRIDRWALGDGNQEMVGRWTDVGGVGNTIPDSKAKHGKFEWVPGADRGGVMAAHPLAGAEVKEDNYYFMARLDNPPAIPSLIVDEREFIITDWTKFQGLEWQWQLQGWGKRWNGAWQIGRTNGVRVWDMTKNGGAWIGAQIDGAGASAQTVPMPDVTNTIKWKAVYSLSPSTNKHIAVQVNGVWVPFSYLQNPVPSNATKFTAAVQIDPLMKAMTGKEICIVTHKSSIWGVW
jgi:hypothetical protein